MQGLYHAFEKQVLQEALLAHSKDRFIIFYCMGNCVIFALEAS